MKIKLYKQGGKGVEGRMGEREEKQELGLSGTGTSFL